MTTCARLAVPLLLASILVAAEAAGPGEAAFRLDQAALGNVFVAPAPVVLPIRTTAETVHWEAHDVWHAPAGSGDVMVADGACEIRPVLPGNGYYTVRLVARRGDIMVADRTTTCAVIPPLPAGQAGETPYGAMTHFAQGWDTDVLELLAKLGVCSIRDEAYWQHVEPEKGRFAFPARFDDYLAAVKRAGLHPLMAMTFGNKLYDGGNAPASDEGRAAYARYGEELLKRYGDQLKWLEVWNEYNGSWCGGEAEQDRPRYYAEMIKAVYPRIKALRPDVQVLGCACVLQPIPYIEGIFKHGGLQAMDAVVIHPYRGQPEGVENEVAELQALIRQYNDGKDKPIWVTETGTMPNPQEFPWEQGRKLWDKARLHTAQYLIRQYALLLSTRTVAKVYWYLTRDYNEFKLMGLLRDPMDPAGRYAVAAPYVAYATLIRQLGPAEAIGRAKTGKFTYVEAFKRGDGEVRVCWATQPAAVALQVAAPVTVVDMMGAETVLTPVDGQVFLTLDQSPVFVRGAVAAVVEGGRFAVAGRQSSDLGQPFAIAWRADPPLSGTLEIAGVDSAISGGGGRIAVPGVATDAPRTEPVRFRLLVGGKPAGLGTATVAVADPLRWSGSAAFAAADAVRLRIDNPSPATSYALTGIDGVGGPVAIAAALEHGTGVTVTVPVAAAEPYRPRRFDLAAGLAGRGPLRQHVEIAWNPCPRTTVVLDGALDEWRGAPAIDLQAACATAGGGVDGQVWLGWDDANLYLAADLAGGSDLRFAVAPTTAGAWADRAELGGWCEFAIDQAGACTTTLAPRGATVAAKIATTDDGGRRRWEVAVPWRVLGLQPGDGSLRLAFAATRGKGTADWGEGIRMGKSPDGFPLCVLTDPARPTAATTAATAVAAPLAATARGTVTPLADAVDDYARTQGGNGWFYGCYRGDGGGSGDGAAPSGPYTDDDFREMTQVQTMWGYTWKGEAQYNEQGAGNMHPGIIGGRPAWAVRRWVSTVDGRVRLTGMFEHHGQGDGTGGRVLVDGVQVFAGLADGGHPGELPFDIEVPVHVGSRIDFALTPGPGTDISYDTSGFRAAVGLVGK